MLRYARRRAALLTSPVELVDRVCNKLEVLHDERRTPHHGKLASPRGDRDWLDALVGFLDAPPADGFSRVWDQIVSELGELEQLDADVRLAEVVWQITRAVRPQVMLETGVSRGVITRVALEAMEVNGCGRLWSIDLPPHDLPDNQARTVVDRRLYSRWVYLHGSSRRHLRPLLRRLGPIDVFVHDSQHTERNMRFELSHAMGALRPGGILVSDDVHSNEAWARVVGSDGLVIDHATKDGLVGVARAPTIGRSAAVNPRV